jgi:hypothetical protein
MKPKNLKERRKTFLRFLLLFLFTVASVLTAVYFNFKVPKKENKLLKTQVRIVKKEMEYQDNFFKEMKSIKGMIDSLDVPGQNISYQTSMISTKLVDLQKAFPTKDSTYKYDMYTSIVGLYVELQNTKDELRSLVDAKSTIEEYKDVLDKCREDLKQAERDLFIARNSN